MCGICGIIEFNKPVNRDLLQGMIQKMHHRGPDDNGIFIDDRVGLGFVRLSIIDLSTDGHQPMISDDGRYTIIFNGEIFNYIELRNELKQNGIVFNTKTDTEVLLKSFIFWGEDCLHKFNGMWAFVIYDKLKNEIFASRDRYGVKPFYYAQTNEGIVFSSEIPSILSVIGKPKPNKQVIFDYLVFNRTDQTEQTFFTGINKLQHGHALRIKNNEVKVSKWYNLREQVKRAEPFKNSDEYLELFKSSIELRLRSDVPVGVCLSGGLDSSSIVTVLLKKFDFKNVNTFSAVYLKGQYGDETEFINEFKSEVKNMHYVTPDAASLKGDLLQFVKVHAEPIPTTGPYAQYKVMELAKGKVVVTLDGQGADEELAGYHYFFGFYYKDLLKTLKLFTLVKEMIYYMKIHRSFYAIKTFLYFLLPESLKTKIRVAEYNYFNSEFVDEHKTANSIAGNIYGSGSLNDALLDHFEYKLEHLLKWEDRNSMAFSLEARVPFLDYRLVERTLAGQSNQKIKNGMTKSILRNAMKGLLPEKIRLRKDKLGYGTPEDEWFRQEEWQLYIRQLLKSNTFRERKIIDAEKALLLYERHVKKEINISKEIWKWIHLELWYREFID